MDNLPIWWIWTIRINKTRTTHNFSNFNNFKVKISQTIKAWALIKVKIKINSSNNNKLKDKIRVTYSSEICHQTHKTRPINKFEIWWATIHQAFNKTWLNHNNLILVIRIQEIINWSINNSKSLHHINRCFSNNNSNNNRNNNNQQEWIWPEKTVVKWINLVINKAITFKTIICLCN